MPEPSKPATPRRQRRGAYLLPSLLTTANMFLGFYAIVQALRGHDLGAAGAQYFDSSAKAIGWAVLFDGWDGRVARMMNAPSDFGRELDSLADCITFGMAPAFLAYVWGIAAVDPSTAGMLQPHLHRLGLSVCFLFLVCGALRLARFNISTNPVPANPGKPGRKYFVGLAIPAGAGVLAAIVHFENGAVNQWVGWPVMWLAIVVGTSLLMVSNWRYFSFKDIRLNLDKGRTNIVLVAALFIAIYVWSEAVLLGIAVIYTLSGVLFRITAMFRRKPALPVEALPVLLVALVLTGAGCGYHVVGTTGSNIPKTIQSIDVPTFRNETSRFKVEQQVTAAVVREMLTRTKYEVRASEKASDADAELRGTITGFSAYPIVFDPQNNRATTALINIRMKVSLIDRKTRKVLYENPDFVYREHYEISGQASTYFDESQAGVDRLSRTLAASLVSSILSAF